MKSFLVLFALFVLSNINALGQNFDEILKECQEKREHDRRVLDNYRQEYEYVGQGNIYCGDQNVIFKYLEDSLYFKLQGKGIMPDSSMQLRILQLLNNEFYEGELEILINDELKSDRYLGLPDSVLSTKRIELGNFFSSKLPRYKRYMLIRACELLDNKQILKRIEELYRDPEYADLQKELLNCLLMSQVEPYTSEFLKHSKYSRTLPGNEQLCNIINLENIYTQESFREIADYLLSNAYWTNEILNDISLMDSIDTSQDVDGIINDDFELILEDETEYVPREYIYINYYHTYAFSIIKAALSNEDLRDLYCKLGMNKDTTINARSLPKRQSIKLFKDININPQNEHCIVTVDCWTKNQCRQIYRWMKKNYGKYEFKKRWR